MSILFDLTIILIILIYWMLKNWIKVQNLFLLGVGYVFYFQISIIAAILLISITLINFYGCILIERYGPKKNRQILYGLIIINLSYLGIFKYYNFFIFNLMNFIQKIGFTSNLSLISLIQPLGISYIVFQLISYDYDIYIGKIKPSQDIVNFSLMMAFFPKLFGTPIERADHLLPQIETKKYLTTEGLMKGVHLVIMGFFKKIVIAEVINNYIMDFYVTPQNYDATTSLLIILCYSIQIYADFSGLTDIVRGISRFFGYDLLKNFEQPYLSINPREFWRRWHISLSTWIRDYIYIPLGGNKKSSKRQYLNLLVAMTLAGLWHGANWTFIIWGFLHGILLIIPRLITIPYLTEKKNHPLFKIIGGVVTYFSVALLWIFFRSPNLDIAIIIFQRLISTPNFNVLQFNNIYFLLFISSAIILFILDTAQKAAKQHEFLEKTHWSIEGLILGLMILCILIFQLDFYTQFIYIMF